MANFEALIRGALASQDASNAQVRAKVYQSSRNALHRLITENRSFTVETAIEQQQELENSIAKIEKELSAQPAPKPVPLPQEIVAPAVPEKAQVQPEAAPVKKDDPLAELQAILDDGPRSAPAQSAQPGVSAPPVSDQTPAEPIPAADPYQTIGQPAVEPVMEPHVGNEQNADPLEDYYMEERQLPVGFSNRRKSQKRFTGLIIFLLIIALLAYIGYLLVTSFVESGLLGNNNQNQNILSRQDNSEDFITVLEASNPSSLIVANRGSAEIINQQNTQMIRIHSTRSAQARNETAEPILLRLPPGVVEQISNKQITVEIFAKSGNSSPAQFTVECQFADAGSCGRKRFRIGLQPEASVFAANVGNITNPDQGLYFAINTDITSGAEVTGKGDVIDIAYVRIRVN